MLKKARKLFRRMKPLAFVMLSMVTTYLAMNKTVIDKAIE